MVHAGHRGLVQPCAVIVNVLGAPALQVEVLAASAFDSPNPPQPQFVSGTILTGTIFETVDGVRQPVPGATIWAYTLFEIDVASTKTDLQGRYFLCNLPQNTYLAVSKDGFKYEETRAFDPAGASPYDVEIERR
jgi:hypothetical protein